MVTVDVDKTRTNYRLLCDLARRARLHIIEAQIAAINGHSPPVVVPELAIDGGGKSRTRTWRLSDLIEAFSKDTARRNRTNKTELDYGMVFRVLDEVIGPNTPVHEINRDHCRQVQSLLDRLPPNATKRFPDLTLAQAAERADRQGLPRLGAATINSHLHKVSALFNWAVKEERMGRNPARGLASPEGKHNEDARHPFTIEELVRIFGPPLYESSIADQARVAGPTATRFWIPLIALFHGMRLNEICQLRREDIIVRDGVWTFAVRSGRSDQRVKTQASRRVVPFHPTMHQLGLPEFVDGRSGEERLFSDLKQDSRGYYSDGFQKWFSRYLRSCGIKDRKKTFHSFRHNWRDALREAGVPQEKARLLGGWKRTSVDEKYGSGLSTGTLAREIGKIRYDGLDLAHLARDQRRVRGAAGVSGGCKP